MHCNPTRRTFLKGTAATAALAAVGTCSVAAWRAEQAEAAATGAVKIQGASLCNGCSSKCGLIATALDGRLWTVEGMKEHPYSKGTLCGRGHGAAQWAYSDGRLTQPMKRAADGSFAPISWDDALSEIGAKVQEIIAEAGPEALAIIQDPRPSGKYYSKRFMTRSAHPTCIPMPLPAICRKRAVFRKPREPRTSRWTSPTPKWWCSSAAAMAMASVPPR